MKTLVRKFKKCGTHTIVDEKDYPLDSIWYLKSTGEKVKIVGYPLNDYYNNNYVGIDFLDKPTKKIIDELKGNEIVMYGGSSASQITDLSKEPTKNYKVEPIKKKSDQNNGN